MNVAINDDKTYDYTRADLPSAKVPPEQGTVSFRNTSFVNNIKSTSNLVTISDDQSDEYVWKLFLVYITTNRYFIYSYRKFYLIPKQAFPNISASTESTSAVNVEQVEEEATVEEALSATLMVYGLNSMMNCEKLFNLLCLYGNVVCVSFCKPAISPFISTINC